MGYAAWLTHSDNGVPLSGTTISPSSAESGYPATNLQDPLLTTVWRATGTTESLLFSGFVVQADVVAILNHNLTSGAVITIAAGPNSSTSAFSTTMTWRELLAFKILAGSPLTFYPFWRITVSDDSNPAGYIEIGYVYIGPLTRLTAFNWRYGATHRTESTNIAVQSVYGIGFVEPLYSCEIIKADFGPISQTQMATLETLYSSVAGDRYPFLYIPDVAVNDAYQMRIVSDFELKLHVQQTTSQRYVTLEMQEDPYGRRF